MWRKVMIAPALAALALSFTGAANAATTSTWTFQPVPAPAGSEFPTLEGVSCPSADSCTAVGAAEVNGTGEAVADSWNGSAWSSQTTSPLPPHRSASGLNGVSCPSATYCVAVGGTSSRSFSYPLAEVWNGSTWTSMTVPAPITSPARSTTLASVSCVSAADCTAVASVKISTSQTDYAFESWNGSTWSVQGIVSNATVGNTISCPTTAGCYVNELGVDSGQAGFWNGSTLTSAPIATPAGGSEPILQAVTCTGATNCIAVGAYAPAGGGANNALLEESWNGSTWSVQPTHTPASYHGGALTSVSCASAAYCTATGSLTNSGGKSQLMALHWSGSGEWAVQAPGQEGADSYSNAVSCGAVGYCMDVGSYFNSTSKTYGLLADSYQPAA
jgi:hypothetical protein